MNQLPSPVPNKENIFDAKPADSNTVPLLSCPNTPKRKRDYLSKLDIICEGGSPAKRSRKNNFEKNFNFWRNLECSKDENIHTKSKFVLPANQPPLSSVTEG